MKTQTSSAFAIFALATLAVLTACSSPSVFTAPDFESYESKHKTVAVLPFAVSIPQENRHKKLEGSELEQLERDQSLNFQRALFLEFSKRGFGVQFQDTDDTNDLLEQEFGQMPTLDDIAAYSEPQLCQILGVDAVINGTMVLSRPIGTTQAVFREVLLGMPGKTNQVQINISLFAADDGKMLWNFNHVLTGGLASRERRIAKNLVRKGAKTFPYQRN